MNRTCAWILAAGLLGVVFSTATSRCQGADEAKSSAETSSLTMVVMDPLARPLSCPCVEGYAQRDYDQLAAALGKNLGQAVEAVYSESLVAALKKNAGGRADLVIGKQSVVLYDAKKAGLSLKKIGMLSGKDGATTQTGLFVVPALDPAQSVADLANYRLFLGPAESDEKHSAALALFKQQGVVPPQSPDIAAACDEGAIQILELAASGVHGCAVISSYAKPLLEGCGQVKKGSLRVVGETAAVPFIAAFVNASLDANAQAGLREALFKATSDPLLRIALETKHGFVAEERSLAENVKKK